MKKLLLIACLSVAAQMIIGQVETRYFPEGNAFEKTEKLEKLSKASKTKILPAFNTEMMLQEDKENENKDIPFRFGKGFDINASLSDGHWSEIDGGRFLSLAFESKGAYSVNFVFNDFYLPEGACLYISNEK